MISKVSIVVPIYMVENYLSDCIDSILNQTYNNLEVILVDDGSKDRCGEICDEYQKKDDRIKIIHKNNGGLSDARNAGIDASTGDYIMFVDSDDTIKPQAVEFLLRPIEEGIADMSVCDFVRVKESFNFPCDIYNYTSPKIISSYDEKTKFFFDDLNVQFTVAWNKLYPKNYFTDIRFPKGRIHEDEFTTYKLLERADRIAYFDVPFYNYTTRETSIMGVGFTPKNLDRFTAFQERIEHYLADKNYVWADRMLIMYKMMIIDAAKFVYIHKKYDYEVINDAVEVYRKLIRRSIRHLPVNLDRKIIYIMFMLFPRLYIRIKMLEK